MFSKGMRKFSVPFLVILLCINLFMAFPCKADVVWSDNFNDGNYDGWFVWNGTFSAEDHTLKPVLGENKYWIGHLSTVTNGTWSFDILVGEVIMITLTYNIIEQGLGVASWFDSEGTHLTLGGVNSEGADVIGEYIFNSGISAWQHIDVTRNVEGRTCVYLNGTLVIDVVDTVVTQSWFFMLTTPYSAYAIDNIVVSNTVDIEPPPPVPFYMQTWFLATVGVVAAMVVVIVVLLMRRKAS